MRKSCLYVTCIFMITSLSGCSISSCVDKEVIKIPVYPKDTFVNNPNEK